MVTTGIMGLPLCTVRQGDRILNVSQKSCYTKIA